MRSYYSLSRGKKIKQQHFSSITHDSNSTDKLEDEGALILTPPPPPSPTMLRFKATQKGEKSKQGCDFTEDRTPDIAH